MNDFIEAKSISFSYRVEDNQKPVNVFENLNVTIREGEMTAVLGHNGSGKVPLPSISTQFCSRRAAKSMWTASTPPMSSGCMIFARRSGWSFRILTTRLWQR